MKPSKTAPPSTWRDLGSWLNSPGRGFRASSTSKLALLGTAWVLIGLGAFFGWINVQDELLQKTYYHVAQWVDGKDKPGEFRAEMARHWLRSALLACPGLILLLFYRRYDRLDPFSPSFRGQKSLDELDQWLDREIDKQHRPLR